MARRVSSGSNGSITDKILLGETTICIYKHGYANIIASGIRTRSIYKNFVRKEQEKEIRNNEKVFKMTKYFYQLMVTNEHKKLFVFVTNNY